MAIYVLVHGACHEGHHFEDCAAHLRAAGHTVFLPTLKGNRPGDSRKTTTLEDSINSLVDYFEENKIDDAILLGHSWGGLPITGAADRLAPGRVRRLIYYSAFVPNNGESLMDMCPPHYQALFPALAGDTGEVLFPFPILREAFINDASAEQAQALFDTLKSAALQHDERPDHPVEEPVGDADRQVLPALHGGYLAAAIAALPSAPVGKAGALPARFDARQPLDLRHRAGASRPEDHRSRQGLIPPDTPIDNSRSAPREAERHLSGRKHS